MISGPSSTQNDEKTLLSGNFKTENVTKYEKFQGMPKEKRLEEFQKIAIKNLTCDLKNENKENVQMSGYEKYFQNNLKEAMALKFIHDFQKQFDTIFSKNLDQNLKDQSPKDGVTSSKLFLTSKNEFGCEKLLTTFIKPTLIPKEEFFEIEGCTKFISQHIKYDSSNVGISPTANKPFQTQQQGVNPTKSSGGDEFVSNYSCFSPSTTLLMQIGDSLEISNVLCSFLIGAGFDAYVAVGKSNFRRAKNRSNELEFDVKHFKHIFMPKKSEKKQEKDEKRQILESMGNAENQKEIKEDKKILLKEEEKKGKKYKLKDRIILESKFVKKNEINYSEKKEKEKKQEKESKNRSENKKSYEFHWVIVLPSKRDIKNVHFCDGCCGEVISLDSSMPKESKLNLEEFHSIKFIYNNKNFFLNMKLAKEGEDFEDFEESRWIKFDFNLKNNLIWESVFFGDDFISKKDLKDLEKIDNLESPLSFCNKLEISSEKYHLRYPNGFRRLDYRNAILLESSNFVQNDLFVKKIVIFGGNLDYKLAEKRIKEVHILFCKRKDKLKRRSLFFYNNTSPKMISNFSMTNLTLPVVFPQIEINNINNNLPKKEILEFEWSNNDVCEKVEVFGKGRKFSVFEFEGVKKLIINKEKRLKVFSFHKNSRLDGLKKVTLFYSENFNFDDQKLLKSSKKEKKAHENSENDPYNDAETNLSDDSSETLSISSKSTKKTNRTSRKSQKKGTKSIISGKSVKSNKNSDKTEKSAKNSEKTDKYKRNSKKTTKKNKFNFEENNKLIESQNENEEAKKISKIIEEKISSDDFGELFITKILLDFNGRNDSLCHVRIHLENLFSSLDSSEISFKLEGKESDSQGSSGITEIFNKMDSKMRSQFLEKTELTKRIVKKSEKFEKSKKMEKKRIMKLEKEKEVEDKLIWKMISENSDFALLKKEKSEKKTTEEKSESNLTPSEEEKKEEDPENQKLKEKRLKDIPEEMQMMKFVVENNNKKYRVVYHFMEGKMNANKQEIDLVKNEIKSDFISSTQVTQNKKKEQSSLNNKINKTLEENLNDHTNDISNNNEKNNNNEGSDQKKNEISSLNEKNNKNIASGDNLLIRQINNDEKLIKFVQNLHQRNKKTDDEITRIIGDLKKIEQTRKKEEAEIKAETNIYDVLQNKPTESELRQIMKKKEMEGSSNGKGEKKKDLLEGMIPDNEDGTPGTIKDKNTAHEIFVKVLERTKNRILQKTRIMNQRMKEEKNLMNKKRLQYQKQDNTTSSTSQTAQVTNQNLPESEKETKKVSESQKDSRDSKDGNSLSKEDEFLKFWEKTMFRIKILNELIKQHTDQSKKEYESIRQQLINDSRLAPFLSQSKEENFSLHIPDND